MADFEKYVTGDLLVPLSGGYDSRFINHLIKDKSRVRNFTYGITKNQKHSSEVVFAKKIAEIHGTDWRRIELNEYNRYIPEWLKLYGVSVHTHGMYHIEFYKKY